MKTIIQEIAQKVQAIKNCKATGNQQWERTYSDQLDELEKLLPSGSGIDRGTTIDREKSSRQKVVLKCEYHHMDENGYYDGWTSHSVIVTPEFHGGIEIRITGRDRNDIKDYLTDTFDHVLQLPANIQ